MNALVANPPNTNLPKNEEMIGKRKRDTSVVPRSTTVEDEEVSPPPPDTSAQDVFRKFFEAQFQPLEVPKRQATDTDASEEEDEDEDDESEDGDTGSEWDGLSGDEGASNAVEVISYADSAKTEAPLDKKARKAFMVCLNLYTMPRIRGLY